MKRSKDPLLAAITTYLKPVISEEGFKRISKQTFGRISNEVFQYFALGRSTWGSKSIRVNYGSMLINCKHEFIGGIDEVTIHPLRRSKSTGLWSAVNHESADLAMQDICKQFKVVASPWFFRTNSPQKLSLQIKNNAYLDGHAYFQMGCCHITLKQKKRALQNLENAAIKYEEDYESRQTQWLVDCIEMTEKIISAINAGTYEDVLAGWKAETVMNLKLQKLIS